MDDELAPEDGDAGRLNRQAERASLFTHTALSTAADRQNQTESLLLGVLDVLLAKGAVNEDEVAKASLAAQERLAQEGETLGPGLAVRVDPQPEPQAAVVDCEDRWPVCHGICCRLSFALTLDEVEAGHVRWDLGQPYQIRQERDGACTHQDRGSGACSVYAHRPGICRTYSCANDERIWSDFEGRVLNQPWIDEHLKPQKTAVTFLQIRAMRRPAQGEEPNQSP